MLSKLIFFFLASIAMQGCVFYTVREQQAGIIERFGKFVSAAKPGLGFKLPIVDNVFLVELRVQQLDVQVETKTKDNVFVSLNIGVQFFVSDAEKAFYRLTNHRAQISSYIFDVVRAEVPKLTLDNVFEKKDDIAEAVKKELDEAMSAFGYSIVKTLVTDIEPNAKVKDAMNEINAATRLRQAAMEKAEAEKILLVKRAEAEAESKVLQGRGIAQQRIEIAKGIEESVRAIAKSASGSSKPSNQEIFSVLLMTQYFDTLKSIGNNSSTLFVPSNPGGVSDMQAQILAAIKASQKNNHSATIQENN
jgi:regulator of protease activity HflC (stomatin/prohibitin superfamily)